MTPAALRSHKRALHSGQKRGFVNELSGLTGDRTHHPQHGRAEYPRVYRFVYNIFKVILFSLEYELLNFCLDPAERQKQNPAQINWLLHTEKLN